MPERRVECSATHSIQPGVVHWKVLRWVGFWWAILFDGARDWLIFLVVMCGACLGLVTIDDDDGGELIEERGRRVIYANKRALFHC